MPADWTKVIIVPVYKGKGRRGDCGSYRGISLLNIPGKVYGKVLTERVQRLTEEKISEVVTRRLQEGKGMCGSDISLQDGSGESISKKEKTMCCLHGSGKSF